MQVKYDTKIEIYVRNEKRREEGYLLYRGKKIYDVEVAKLTYIIYVKTIDINFFSRVASSFNGKSLALVLVWLVYDMSKGLKNVYVMIFEHPE